MDDITPLQAFHLVVVLLAIPGIAIVAILVFVFAQSDFLPAVSLTSAEVAHTAPAVMVNLTGSSQFDEPTGSIAAAAIVVTIPIVIFMVIFQRRIIASFTPGAVED